MIECRSRVSDRCDSNSGCSADQFGAATLCAANPVARSQIEIASGRADCLPLIEDQAHRAGFEDPNALQSVRVEMF